MGLHIIWDTLSFCCVLIQLIQLEHMISPDNHNVLDCKWLLRRDATVRVLVPNCSVYNVQFGMRLPRFGEPVTKTITV